MLSSSRASNRGLNLIEVGVVLVILGLSITAVAPTITEWMQNLAVRNAGEAIKTGLERARVEALRRNTRISFWLVSDAGNKTLTDTCVLNASGPSWVVAGANPEGLCGTDPSLTTLPQLVDRWAAADGGQRVTVTGLDVDGNSASQVDFNSLGQAATGASQLARITLSHEDGKARPLEILVAAGGGVRMCDPNAGVNDPRRC